ncbi:Uncharacterized protein FWK35_00014037 [Aphis craccivora]|uniref:Uncharacterized protein n=1 Tax=Aphis craccivora TaxID=307492 RepID=A0A6G0YYI5_APHCR|nr:Uncharacterized protein FWK35_00014037 [Aphis craccivora]
MGILHILNEMMNGGFRWRVEYTWCIKEVQIINLPAVFKKLIFFYIVVTHKPITSTSHSERSDECIDFTMIITSRNNAPFLNFGGGFRCNSEHLWCIIEVKSKHFPTVYKQIEKNEKKNDGKMGIFRKTSFRPN